jgi:hypothetical protein
MWCGGPSEPDQMSLWFADRVELVVSRALMVLRVTSGPGSGFQRLAGVATESRSG